MEKRGRGRPPKSDAALGVEIKVRFSPEMIAKVDKLTERREPQGQC